LRDADVLPFAPAGGKNLGVPGTRRKLAGDHSERAGFPSAVDTQQPEALPTGHTHGEVLHGSFLGSAGSEGFGDAVQNDAVPVVARFLFLRKFGAQPFRVEAFSVLQTKSVSIS
jgi:hypothetical protein